MKNTYQRSMSLLFSIVTICSCVRAQESQMDGLARQLAGPLAHSHAKTVAVFDFAGPYGMEGLGRKLYIAADFNAALAKSASGFQVEDGSHLAQVLQMHSVASGSIRDSETGSRYLRQTGIDDAFVLGTISKGIGGLEISVEAYNVADSGGIAQFKTAIPVTENLKALIGENDAAEFGSLPKGGKNGYSGPSCLHCPQPQFPEEAIKNKRQGAVVLEFTVDEAGHAKDIRVKKALPDGFTDRAIKAVEGWRFKPATGPDGEPAAVRQDAQVTFHLF